MSHETLASAWSALFELQDLTAGLRDVIGHMTLRQIRSSYHPEDTPKRFLEYAHELSITLDAIRFLSKIDSKKTTSLQEDLISAVAHFLNGLAIDFGGERSFIKEESHRLVLGHAFCSAVAALRTCAWDCRQELRTVLCKPAGKLLNNAPVKDESLWMFQTLANLLVSHYSSATPLGQGTDQSKTRWKMLWEAKTGRTSIIQDMVRRATDYNVASAERILPMLDLCQLYWDTDTLLIQACIASTKSRWLERVFYVPSDTDAAALAMEVRFTVQEQFAIRNTQVPIASDKLQTQLYVMFSPGLRFSCVSDQCSCSFDETVSKILSNARSKQNDLLRSSVEGAYKSSPLDKISHDSFDQIYLDFSQRLQRSPVPIEVDLPEPQYAFHSDTATTEILPLRPRLMSAHSADESMEEHYHPEMKPRSFSQPNIHRRSSRPLPPSHRASDWALAQAVLETQVEEPHSVEPDPYNNSDPLELEAPLSSGMSSPGMGTPGMRSPGMAPELGRTESVTTTSTSTGYRSQSSHAPRPALLERGKVPDSALPEAVHVFGDRAFVRDPQDYEKSYPELVVNPVTAIQEDNMSLFSESGSMPMTTRSASRATTQNRFSLFKAGKKSGAAFVTPHVRFFASGKQMIAWTKYGGVCFDINNPDNTKIEPINSGEIILAAGGSRRYGIVARYQEAYTLSVYNLGDNDPGLKVNLGSCPKAMDLSKNDRYLAIKYAQGVRMFDLEKATKIDHKLPKMECTSSPPGGHLVTFSHDSQSFMASTRLGPEKVLTYWSQCMDKSKHMVVHSNAPCGNIDDHGLTTLLLAGPSVRGIPTGFLSTFTEKGSPVILSMNSNQPHAIPVRGGGSRDLIGTRIHAAAMHVDPHTKKSNLVMVNQNNDIFWISDLFGRGQDVQRLKSLKRPKSMKPELMVAMANADEASIFWIDAKTRTGVLIKVGRSGGITKPFEIRLDIEPMCAG